MDDRRISSVAARPRPPAPRTILGLQIAAVVILVGWALHATASVSALIAAAIFVAIAMAPVHRWATGLTGRRWVGHIATFVAMGVLLLAFAGGLFFAAQRVAEEFPSLSGMAAPTDAATEGGEDAEQVDATTGAAPAGSADDGSGRGGLGGILGSIEVAGGQAVSRLADLAADSALAVLRYATSAVAGLILVIFLSLILLIDAPRWKARVARVFGDDHAAQAGDVVTEMSRQLVGYVLVRAGIGLLTAGLYMLFLWIFDVGLVFVWGVLAFLLSFVPNLGSIVSGILPTIYAFLTRDLGTAIAVGAVLTAIEQVVGNYVDPRLQSRQVSISPAVIFAALLLFAWIWGVPGTLLSTPVLIAAVVAFSRMDRLRPVALLLSNTRSYEELDAAVRN